MTVNPDLGALTGSDVDAGGARVAAQLDRSGANGAAVVSTDAGNDLGQLRAKTISWFTAALKAIGISPFINLIDVRADWTWQEIAEELTDAVFADAAFVAGWTPPGEAEWGVDRGAVFSLHDDAADATEVFSRCLANGVRARLVRRNVGPWIPVTA